MSTNLSPSNTPQGPNSFESILGRTTSIGNIIVAFVAVVTPLVFWCVKLEVKTSHYDYLASQNVADQIKNEQWKAQSEQDSRAVSKQITRVETKINLIMSALKVGFKAVPVEADESGYVAASKDDSENQP